MTRVTRDLVSQCPIVQWSVLSRLHTKLFLPFHNFSVILVISRESPLPAYDSTAESDVIKTWVASEDATIEVGS